MESPGDVKLQRRSMEDSSRLRHHLASSLGNVNDPDAEDYRTARNQGYLRSYSCPAKYKKPVNNSYEAGDSSVESGSDDFTYVTNDPQTVTVPVTVCVIIMVGYIMFGSMIFRLWEKWDQLDGSYFCFISLSSIGFGDIVPGNSIKINTGEVETSFIVCSVYLMLGMAMIAMCFNLMQEQVRQSFTRIKLALKRICKCKR